MMKFLKKAHKGVLTVEASVILVALVLVAGALSVAIGEVGSNLFSQEDANDDGIRDGLVFSTIDNMFITTDGAFATTDPVE